MSILDFSFDPSSPLLRKKWLDWGKGRSPNYPCSIFPLLLITITHHLIITTAASSLISVLLVLLNGCCVGGDPKGLRIPLAAFFFFLSIAGNL
jgi:hypothetical protein